MGTTTKTRNTRETRDKTIILHPKAEEFYRSTTRLNMFIGGVRSMKTFTGALKGISLAKQFGGSRGIVVGQDYTVMMDVLFPTYIDILTHFNIQFKKWEGSRPRLELANESMIYFRSGHNPEKLKSRTLDWFHIDEPASLKARVFTELYNRISFAPVLKPEFGHGLGWLTGTPEGRNWYYDLYMQSLTDKDITSWIIYTREAGLVSREEVEKARLYRDPREFKQDFEASFEINEGLIYSSFGEDNIRELKYNPDLPLFIAYDAGWNDPTAILWYQYDKGSGNWYVLQEFVQSYVFIETQAKLIKGEEIDIQGRKYKAPAGIEALQKTYETTGHRPFVGGADISASVLVSDGRSEMRTLVDQGIPRNLIQYHSHLWKDGIRSVRLHILNAAQGRHLYVDPSCKTYIRDKMHFSYPQKDGMPLGEAPMADNPTGNHKYSHTNEAEKNLLNTITPATKHALIGVGHVVG